MSAVAASTGTTRDPVALARTHAMLRFATGITVALILSEAMGWAPTFLPPVLLATLLTSLPSAPPFKTGLVLVVVMALAAALSFVLPSLLHNSPLTLVALLGIIIFFAFLAMALEKAKLPALLLLICVATVPVIVMVAPAQGGLLPFALFRGMAVAVLLLWCMYAIWPRVVPRTAAPPAAPVGSPAKTALVGTAVVMPVMIIYLLFGLADALPVLVTTIFLVINFDVRQGVMAGAAFMIGNLIGGLVGVLAFLLLGIAPSLFSLGLITFLIAMAFAVRVDKGGPGAAVAGITCNSFLIIFSSAIASGADNSGILLTRLFQFAIACTFAIAMMIVVWGRKKPGTPTHAGAGA